ncbi:hypothetical protein ACFWF3_34690, partial [Nocardia sp. NPDC060220]|uniref:hypothetical protein n=1 Tax=Nocardia sp. NPDC060220 TaxID=3347076 RepID=UPI00364C940F
AEHQPQPDRDRDQRDTQRRETFQHHRGKERDLTTMLFALLADHERAAEAGDARATDTQVWAEIIDMLAGSLAAPVSTGGVLTHDARVS